ncbi:hypothetical protein STEG23_021138, partial [Scotinomys teguina]
IHLLVNTVKTISDVLNFQVHTILIFPYFWLKYMISSELRSYQYCLHTLLPGGCTFLLNIILSALKVKGKSGDQMAEYPNCHHRAFIQ